MSEQKPTIAQLEKIAEEIARLEEPTWYEGKDVSVTFNENARLYRVRTTDGVAFNDITLDLVQNVWLQRQIDGDVWFQRQIDGIVPRLKREICAGCELAKRVEKLEQTMAKVIELAKRGLNLI